MARGVLEIDAVAQIASFGPRLDHVGCKIEKADDNFFFHPKALITSAYQRSLCPPGARLASAQGLLPAISV
jgi:hypothetical protein